MSIWFQIVDLDIPRIFTALAEWAACMVFILLLKRRPWAKGWRFIAACAGELFLQSVFLVETGRARMFLWGLFMLIAFLFMFAFIYACVDEAWSGCLFFSFFAFQAAEFSASFTWQVFGYGNIFYAFSRTWRVCLILLIYALLFSLLFFIGIFVIRKRSYPEIMPRDAVIGGILVLLAFGLSNLSFLVSEGPFAVEGILGLHYVRTIVDLCGVFALFFYLDHLHEQAVKLEMLEMDHVLKLQYNQYRNYQESIDLINRKYHDLKHEIAGLRSESDPETREAWIRAMEEELQDFKPATDTGNPVLNTLIAGKESRMYHNQITFTCVCDGQLLANLSVRDICTMFGNALDNAIEAAAQVKDPSCRFVHLTVARKKDFVMIQLRNTCGEEPLFEDELPCSGKDGKYHGFGTKSIRQTARKYGGDATFSYTDGHFDVSILLPLA